MPSKLWRLIHISQVVGGGIQRIQNPEIEDQIQDHDNQSQDESDVKEFCLFCNWYFFNILFGDNQWEIAEAS